MEFARIGDSRRRTDVERRSRQGSPMQGRLEDLQTIAAWLLDLKKPLPIRHRRDQNP
jgi:hypothetical protein